MSNGTRGAGGRRRRRIAVIGGGLSGLTAAYELSRTPELRSRYEVTVHQMGHRLGGKLASGRNAAAAHRNEEHGLHVWFGFYENAFRLGREVYERWQKPRDCPYRSIFDALTPHSYTPFGVAEGDRFRTWPLLFPRNPGTPGDGSLVPLGPTTLRGILDFARAQIKWHAAAFEVPLPPVTTLLPEGIRRRLFPDPGAPPRRADALLAATLRPVSRALEGILARRTIGEREARALHATLVATHRLVRAVTARLPATPAVRTNVVHPLDFLFAFARGLLSPRYGVYRDGDLGRLDHLELRRWLGDNGASDETLRDWAPLRIPYDACFQYVDGDPNRPDFEAGTAARIILRAGLTYKNAVLYLLDAGMGESFVAPLHEVLVDQGVRFELFHRLDRLELDARGRHAQRLHMARQATVRGGAYRPTFTFGGLPCWPSEPDWSQLVEGEALREAGVDLESVGSANPFERREVLERGVDFDDVVLALPLGVLAAPDGRPSPCEALLRHNARLRACAARMNLVPTVAAQLWVDRDLDELGFGRERPAMVSWAPPYDVWADMTPVLRHEGWPGDRRPRGTHYLCGTFDTALHRSDAPTAKAEATAEAERALRAQLEAHGPTLWPDARDAGGAFDWSVLHDPEDRAGAARLGAQYVRANVEPTDLCDAAATGTSQLRLEAHESGLANLALCGTYLRTGINSTCVEAAVMAGMAAARAVHGDGRVVIGEDFMARPASRGALPVDRDREKVERRPELSLEQEAS